MSRAFVTEHDGWNYCWEQSRDCSDANLRGRCERAYCKYALEPDGESEREARKKAETDR